MIQIGFASASCSKNQPGTVRKVWQVVPVNPDACFRQRTLAFFFLGVFLLLNIPSKHEITRSWMPVLWQEKGSRVDRQHMLLLGGWPFF